MRVIAHGILLLMIAAAAGFAQSPDALFQARCAQCHKSDNAVGAPLPETLRQMSWQTILAALETGKMKAISEEITSGQREAIAKYMGTDASQTLPASSKCSAAPQRRTAASKQQNWNGWADAANTRFQPAGPAGLTSQTTPKLKLKWAFGFPGVTTALGVPTVFDGRVFIGAADGTVYSLDAQTGCIHWTYAALSGVRVSPVIGNGAAYFGDLRGNDGTGERYVQLARCSADKRGLCEIEKKVLHGGTDRQNPGDRCKADHHCYRFIGNRRGALHPPLRRSV